MQQLHDEFASVAVTAADKFDPARAVQQLRRICHELGNLGDNVVEARQSNALLQAVPDKQYGSLKTALLCEKPNLGGSEGLGFDAIVQRATVFHAMQIRGKVSDHDDGSGSHGRALNTVTHGGARGFRKRGGRGGRGGLRGNGGKTANGSTSSDGNNSNNSGGTSGEARAGNAQGARGNDRGSQASGGKGAGMHRGRCRYCHNSTEHGWYDCPLRLRNEAEDAKEQAHTAQDSTTQAWFTRVEVAGDELEEFAIAFGNDAQELKALAAALPEERAVEEDPVQDTPVALPDRLFIYDPQALQVPAAALPEDRAAGVEQVYNAPVTALPDGLVVCDPQALQVPAAALPEERAADEDPVQDTPVALPDDSFICDPHALQVPTAVPPAEGVAGHGPAERPAGSAELPAEDAAGDGPAERPAGDQQAEDANETTELVTYTSGFQVEKGESKAVGDTTLYIDSGASSHMVNAQSRMFKHVLNPVDCAVRIIGSCGTSSATKKGTLKFGIRNAHEEVVKVGLNVLLVRDLGTNILSVGALAEKGLKCDLISTLPALRRGDRTFPISTAVPRMYMMNVIVDDLNLHDVDVYHTKVDAHLWHRRMGHCNPRALQQLADKGSTGISFHRNIESGDCSVCVVGDSKKSSHPLSDRPSSETRLEIVSADVWGKPSVKSHGGCQSAVMFTDDASRMRFGFPIKTKGETAEALQSLIRDVADPLGQSIGTVHCDGGAEFKGRCFEMCKSVGITVNNSPPYVPQGDAIAERGFGTIIGTTRKMLLGAPHLPSELLWDPAESCKITSSAEVSFRDKEMRDVVKPKVGHDPFPAPNVSVYQPAAVESSESEDEDTTPTGPPPVAPGPRRSDRTSVAPQRLNLYTTEEDAYERIEHALVTGSDVGSIGSGRPGEVGNMPADPANYDEAVSGPDAERWRASMGDEEQSLYDHDVFDWVYVPEGKQLIPSKLLFRWTFNQDIIPVRPKTRVVVQGFHEADTGVDKAAPVASMESVHLVVSHAAYYGLVLKQADIKTAFLNSRMPEGAKPVYVIPTKGFRCTPEQAKQVWRFKAWLYGLRLSPKGWNGTFHQFLLELGFVPSTADPCLYILHAGEVILLVYVDDILLTGTNAELVSTIIELIKERFETVDIGDAKFILGMAIHRDRDAGTILLTQEAYTKAVLAKFGMADLHPTKTPAEVGPMSTVEQETLTPDEATMFRGSRPDIPHDTGNLQAGVIIELAEGVVDSTAAKQTVTAVSSAEAEYVAMSKACKIILYWRHLLKTINREQKEATILSKDNTGAI
ncbi:unnamed protein product [Ectocarpus sp. CCAP 1310/34]|nr:unnamed protein product [Ectocarpus sp. CCAP 1310/34]